MDIFSSSNKCSKCGETVPGGAKFCHNCGATRLTRCPQCGKGNDAGAKFCVSCGKSLDLSSLEGTVWKRKPGDFITKIAISPTHLYTQRNITIEHGTRAFIFADGRLVEELGSGNYDIGVEPPRDSVAHTAWRKIRSVLSALGIVDGRPTRETIAYALLVDEGDLSLTFKDVPAYTKDPIKVAIETRLVVAVHDPLNVLVNLMKTSDNYTLQNLEGVLRDELENALNESLGTRSAFDLSTDLSLKTAIGEEVARHLQQSLGRYGLEFKQVQTVRFVHAVLDQQKRLKEELLLQATEQDARNEGRRRLFDALNEAQLQTIFELTKRTENFERKLRVTERLRTLVVEDKVDVFQRLYEIEKGRITADEQLKELVIAFTDRKEDHVLARKQLIARLEEEHRLQLKALTTAGEGDIVQQRIEQGVRGKKTLYTADHDERRATAQVDGEVGSIQRDGKVKDVEAMLRLREEKIRIDQKEEDAKAEREQAVKDRELQRQLAIIKTGTDAEKERLAHDLRKTEVMKGLSETQIMAMMAKDAPGVVEALKEYAKAQGQVAMNAEARALQEKLAAAYKESADRVERMHDRSLSAAERMSAAAADRERGQKQEIKEVLSDSMDRNADVAASAAGGPGVIGTGRGRIICPKCHMQVLAGAKFCGNCGNSFYV